MGIVPGQGPDSPSDRDGIPRSIIRKSSPWGSGAPRRTGLRIGRSGFLAKLMGYGKMVTMSSSAPPPEALLGPAHRGGPAGLRRPRDDRPRRRARPRRRGVHRARRRRRSAWRSCARSSTPASAWEARRTSTASTPRRSPGAPPFASHRGRRRWRLSTAPSSSRTPPSWDVRFLVAELERAGVAARSSSTGSTRWSWRAGPSPSTRTRSTRSAASSAIDRGQAHRAESDVRALRAVFERCVARPRPGQRPRSLGGAGRRAARATGHRRRVRGGRRSTAPRSLVTYRPGAPAARAPARWSCSRSAPTSTRRALWGISSPDEAEDSCGPTASCASSPRRPARPTLRAPRCALPRSSSSRSRCALALRRHRCGPHGGPPRGRPWPRSGSTAPRRATAPATSTTRATPSQRRARRRPERRRDPRARRPHRPGAARLRRGAPADRGPRLERRARHPRPRATGSRATSSTRPTSSRRCSPTRRSRTSGRATSRRSRGAAPGVTRSRWRAGWSASIEMPRQLDRVPLGAANVVPCELDGERILALVATGSSEVLVDSNSRHEPSWVDLRFDRVEVKDVPGARRRTCRRSTRQLGVPIKALLGAQLLRHAHVTFDRRGDQFVVRRQDAPPPARREPRSALLRARRRA